MVGDPCSQIVFSKCHVMSAPPLSFALSLLHTEEKERRGTMYQQDTRKKKRKKKMSEARCKQMGCVGSGHNLKGWPPLSQLSTYGSPAAAAAAALGRWTHRSARAY